MMCVIPKDNEDCIAIAKLESEQNWMTYERHGRTDQQMRDDIYKGKLLEAKFALLHKDYIEPGSGVRILEDHPDDGTDMKLKKIGPIQLKTCSSKFVNDHDGSIKAKWPAGDYVLLVVGFTNDKKCEFYAQAPSKLNWRKSWLTSGHFLDRRDMIKWTTVDEMHEEFGSFPKQIHPDDDLPKD